MKTQRPIISIGNTQADSMSFLAKLYPGLVKTRHITKPISQFRIGNVELKFNKKVLTAIVKTKEDKE